METKYCDSLAEERLYTWKHGDRKGAKAEPSSGQRETKRVVFREVLHYMDSLVDVLTMKLAKLPIEAFYDHVLMAKRMLRLELIALLTRRQMYRPRST